MSGTHAPIVHALSLRSGIPQAACALPHRPKPRGTCTTVKAQVTCENCKSMPGGGK